MQAQSYQMPQSLQWLMTNMSQALVPTYGVNPEPSRTQKSCLCHRKAGDCSPGKHPRLPWVAKPDGYQTGVLAAYAKGYCDDPASVGWAVVTGRAGLAALDVDPRNGGEETLAALLAEHGPLPATPADETGGGGWHWYFRWPHGTGRASLDLGPGVELLVGNHLVQVAPSVHYSGHEYRWLAPPWETPFAALPDWMAERVRASLAPPPISPLEARYAEIERRLGGDRRVERARAYLARVPVAVAGQGGYAHTNAAIYSVVDGFALNEAQGIEVCLEWNAGCLPPWKPREIRDKVRWVIAKGGQSGRLLERRSKRAEPVRRIKFVRGRPTAEVAAPPSGPAAEKPLETEADVAPQRDWLTDLNGPPIGNWSAERLDAELIRQRGQRRDQQADEARAAAIKSAEELARLKNTTFKCKRPLSLINRRTDPHGRTAFIVLNPRCDCWSCLACSGLHREEWASNYFSRLSAHVGLGGPAYTAEIDESDHVATVARIRRLKGNYFFFGLPDGRRLIVSDVAFAGSAETTRLAAADRLTALVKDYVGDRKPVGGSSRRWSLPKPEKSPNTHDLQAVVNDDLADARPYERLAAIGVDFEDHEPPAGHKYLVRRYRKVRLDGLSRAKEKEILRRLTDLPVHKVRYKRDRSRPDDPDSDRESSAFDLPVKEEFVTGKSNAAQNNAQEVPF